MKKLNYSFSIEEVNLITYALRNMAEGTGFKGIKSESEDLINYIESETKAICGGSSSGRNNESDSIHLERFS